MKIKNMKKKLKNIDRIIKKMKAKLKNKKV